MASETTSGKPARHQTSRKFALLIGVSEFGEGFKPLHTPINAIQQFREVLVDPAIGGFDPEHVELLANPDVGTMRSRISQFFGDRHRGDLLLFYFVGHGVKDLNGEFHFTTKESRKFDQGQGELNRGTAVDASFVLQEMGNSHSKRQVGILDCCFSGAFPDGYVTMGEEDLAIDVQKLGGKGRAILTAAASTQYALEQDGEDLSVYTRYLLEGLKTGAAAPDDQQWVEVGHLHDYVRHKLETAAASMSPQIYAAREGRSIVLAKAPVGDPALRYHKLVQNLLWESGHLSPVGRRRLKRNGQQWGLKPEDMEAIEEEVCRPYVERRENLAEYEVTYREALEYENPPSERLKGELIAYQRELNLRDEDVETVHAKFLDMLRGEDGENPPTPNTTQLDSPTKPFTPEKSFMEDLGDGISLEMVYIPGGTFKMGSPDGKGRKNEHPQHDVTVPSFYMGKYLVTQVVYEAVIGKKPSRFKGKNRPVEQVSWHEAIAFCKKLSERTGKEYRLPSEA
ncbi:MAG: SUMF1/EgtB/PvdO family nonheme iron enzyme, partial [Merismopedia sp. SIO2A8]|nr:SUMF1/EgtB/PvdO family nonheme iron enzyme [Merismopedia sp. SIO2A8]